MALALTAVVGAPIARASPPPQLPPTTVFAPAGTAAGVYRIPAGTQLNGGPLLAFSGGKLTGRLVGFPGRKGVEDFLRNAAKG